MPVEDQLVDKWKASEGRSLLEIATGYKTSKDLPALTEINKEKIHTALLAAGMTPGLGNVADAADALLYAAEGEFGSAGLSVAAMAPIAGQLVSAKRSLKAAKKSGEKMVTLYRGLGEWYPGKMVKKGMFVGKDKIFHATPKKRTAKYYRGRGIPIGSKGKGVLLEFEVPKKYIEKHGKYGPYYDKPTRGGSTKKEILFERGLPKEFLKKVHK